LLRADWIPKILLLPVILFLFNAWALSADNEDIRFNVRRVSFSGIKNVEKENFAELLNTQSPPFWKFWAPHSVVTLTDVDEDVLKIKQYYRTQGFYHATVTYKKTLARPAPASCNLNESENTQTDSPSGREPEDAACLGEYDIFFDIVEGPSVTVKSIAVNGVEGLNIIPESQIKNEIPLKPDKIFKSEDYEESKAKIKKMLGNHGYPFAEAIGRARVDLNDNTAAVTFDMKPGELFYFGKLNISGYENFLDPTVIQRAMTFRPGQPYSTEKIDESRSNLFDLNVFKTAVVNTGEPDTTHKTVPIDISVKPRDKQSVSLGVGYGTEDGLRLQGGWAYRNLTGYADRISITAKRSDLKETIFGEYQYPYFLSSRNNLVADSGFEREKSDYYTLRNVYTRVNILRKLRQYWTANVGYNLEANRPEDIKVGYVDEDINDFNDENFRVSSVLIGIDRSTLNDQLNPSRGTVLSFSFENASDNIGSEISYLKPVAEAKIFIPVMPKLVFAERARFIAIEGISGTKDIPIYKQLFLGGSKTVRGYGYQKMGVINDDNELVSVGGQSSFVANSEMRFPLYKDFSGVAFLDMGVMDTEAFKYEFDNMRYTCGLGLRYETVIGPIQLDVGYKLNPPEKTASGDVETTEQAETDRWHFYLNIGHAF